jgi:hypothetical protein
MEFFNVCSCDDRKSRDAKQSKESRVDAAGNGSPASTQSLQIEDHVFDGLVLARPRPADFARTFDNSPPADDMSPVPRAVATPSRGGSDGKEFSYPSPLPSPSSRRSWRHAMAEVMRSTYPQQLCLFCDMTAA